MDQEHASQPGYEPNNHVGPGTTIDFAGRVVSGTCYDFEAGQEFVCRRCGGRETERISPAGGPIRCNDGAVACDAGVTKCKTCGHAYVWRINGD